MAFISMCLFNLIRKFHPLIVSWCQKNSLALPLRPDRQLDYVQNESRAVAHCQTLQGRWFRGSLRRFPSCPGMPVAAPSSDPARQPYVPTYRNAALMAASTSLAPPDANCGFRELWLLRIAGRDHPSDSGRRMLALWSEAEYRFSLGNSYEEVDYFDRRSISRQHQFRYRAGCLAHHAERTTPGCLDHTRQFGRIQMVRPNFSSSLAIGTELMNDDKKRKSGKSFPSHPEARPVQDQRISRYIAINRISSRFRVRAPGPWSWGASVHGGAIVGHGAAA